MNGHVSLTRMLALFQGADSSRSCSGRLDRPPVAGVDQFIPYVISSDLHRVIDGQKSGASCLANLPKMERKL
jgi:hypothetical protein